MVSLVAFCCSLYKLIETGVVLYWNNDMAKHYSKKIEVRASKFNIIYGILIILFSLIIIFSSILIVSEQQKIINDQNTEQNCNNSNI